MSLHVTLKLCKTTTGHTYLILCFAGELALDIGLVGTNENDNDSHYHGNMEHKNLFLEGCLPQLALDIGLVGTNENDNGSHYHGNMKIKKNTKINSLKVKLYLSFWVTGESWQGP